MRNRYRKKDDCNCGEDLSKLKKETKKEIKSNDKKTK